MLPEGECTLQISEISDFGKLEISNLSKFLALLSLLEAPTGKFVFVGNFKSDIPSNPIVLLFETSARFVGKLFATQRLVAGLADNVSHDRTNLTLNRLANFIPRYWLIRIIGHRFGATRRKVGHTNLGGVIGCDHMTVSSDHAQRRVIDEGS